jgi:hypothetical protein
LAYRPTLDAEVEQRLLEQHPLPIVLVPHLLDANGAPRVDAREDRRDDGVLVVDVLFEHAIEAFGVLAQRFEQMRFPRRDGQRQSIDVVDDRPETSVLGKDAGSYALDGGLGRQG